MPGITAAVAGGDKTAKYKGTNEKWKEKGEGKGGEKERAEEKTGAEKARPGGLVGGTQAVGAGRASP